MEYALVWFRRDLRLTDNPALAGALADRSRVIPVYVHAPEEHGSWLPGAASNWWLHHSLAALAADLAQRGCRLIVRRGPSLAALTGLARECGAARVYWNRCYESVLLARDTAIEQALAELGLGCRTFNGSLLHEPWSVRTAAGHPFRVFGPFWKACQQRPPQSEPLAAPVRLPPVPRALASLSVDALALLPRPRWDGGLTNAWTIGERAATRRLEGFLDGVLENYPTARDRPDVRGTSRLSAHLHFGELSPRQIAHAVIRWQTSTALAGAVSAAEAFLRELGWREFAYHLLHHFPQTPERPLDARFERFPWSQNYTQALRIWQRGETGYPIIDAGMRELWSTGWMHNRVRMIVASFLVKNLRIPWTEGERWFWDTLVDADLANNTLGWQWSAGCGADAAPYFRIFNPVLQGSRFDPQGTYVRRWLPQLAELPVKRIHQPWTDAPSRSKAAYPEPMVDLAESRRAALDAFQWMKTRAGRAGAMAKPDARR